jgi:hypothetical protein
MRLLNAKTKKLEEFFEKDVPAYAILSHTWGDHEVLFKDITKGRYNNDSEKIEGCCRLALENGLDYVWIDTCCIDKRSSAELSEAINSMFHWYQDAKVCYAYLSDVHDTMDLGVPESTLAFRKSRWWTRGWTLQELLAPRIVEFYSASWTHLGDKLHTWDPDSPPAGSINGLITEITGIKISYLNYFYSSGGASIAEKMSWAALRQVTRVEDVGYSLLGIFDVNMPLLYGEKHKAFLRLQEAIISSSDDQSIFAWKSIRPQRLFIRDLLAESPSDFEGTVDIVPYTPDWSAVSHYSKTNAGLQISMRIREIPGSNGVFLGLLNCARRVEKGLRNLAITLIPSPKNTTKATMAGQFIKCGKYPVSISLSWFQEPDNNPAIPIYIISDYRFHKNSGLMFKTSANRGGNFIQVLEVYPPAWDAIVDVSGIWEFSEIGHMRDSGGETMEQQTIYLHCLTVSGEFVVVRLKYGFKRTIFTFYPSTLEFEVAHSEPGISLAEAMFLHEGRIDAALKWQQQLDLKDGILKFRVEKKDPQLWIFHPETLGTRALQDKFGNQAPLEMMR